MDAKLKEDAKQRLNSIFSKMDALELEVDEAREVLQSHRRENLKEVKLSVALFGFSSDLRIYRSELLNCARKAKLLGEVKAGGRKA